MAVQAFARDYARSIRSAGSGNSGSTGSSTSGGRTGSGSRGSGGVRRRAAASGARLARFLSTAQQHGLREALKGFDLEKFRDASLEDLCDALLEALTEPDGLLEDSALREAMDRTLEELSSNAKTADELEALLTGKDVHVAEVVATYYSHVLAVNFEVKEFYRIREKVKDAQVARAFLVRARDFIRGFVEYRLSREVDLTKYDLNGAVAIEMAGRLNIDVIEAIGGNV